jgi:hypothetical protein
VVREGVGAGGRNDPSLKKKKGKFIAINAYTKK